MDSGYSTLAFTYGDGPFKVVHGSERWRLSSDGRILDIDGEAYRVIERVGGAAAQDLTLVADGKGNENGHEVAVQILLTRRGSRLHLSRLTAKLGEPFLMRHAYTLQETMTLAKNGQPVS